MIGQVISWIALRAIALPPATRCFTLKRCLLRIAGHTVGSNVRICSSVAILVQGRLVVGDDAWIGHQTMIVGGEADVRIGSRVDIAPRVLIATGTHEVLLGRGKAAGAGYSSPVVIGNGVWVGANATILGGSVIGECSIVAAGSVVRGEFPRRSLIAGVPATVVRRLEHPYE